MFQKQPNNPSIEPARPSTKMLSKYLITGLTFIFIYYLWPSSVPYEMDRKMSSKPSIGISLTAAYGTISLRHSDGSFEDLARVEGDSSYIEMMRRLSSPAASHPSPPYSSMDDMWDDIPRQAWRSFRKKIGLAASPDVHVMSQLVKKLLSLSKSATLPYVIISYPGMEALYEEDIYDMAEYLGLPKLTGIYEYYPQEAYAAYAGHGLGLCEHFKDKDRCKDEGNQLPMHETLLVEYTDQAILLHITYLRTVNVDRGSADPLVTASFELGANSRVDKHASHVAEFVHQFLSAWFEGPLLPDELLVIMTGTRDEAIEGAIQEAAERVVPKTQIIASKSEFIASRGSAELAWRVNIMELS
ncbi:hypothetical protein PEX2_048130 [Penicillium expansum]|uniref:Uncharacterized protein n=1 Tax=Penicillium expansum TaxID=27334 RepID=A0A0A2JC17_PENEN|nr:hypothetical protein PEX2_048130 [Penicillium expansum]KGO52914.1 hypothetical protein PEX2_048130 [Penicillium expansum]